VRANVRAGLALFNDGFYHAAHDPLEAAWLESDRDDTEGRFLQGLVQLTAAVHHARGRNWEGCVGLAASGREYLDDVPGAYAGVDVTLVRRVLETLATDPEVVERRPMPALTVDGERVTRERLEFDAAVLSAEALAEERELDASVIERAAAYAREDRERAARDDPVPASARNEAAKLERFLVDFATNDADYDVVYARLADHVDRRDHRVSDVDGLFD
jgi:predicted metal-dependent hydrolase